MNRPALPACDVLVAGCGDVGTRLARALAAEGLRVAALTRGPARHAALAAHGIPALAADLDAGLPALPAAARVYHLVPPPARGEDDPRLARLLAALPRPPARLVYLGTTGVYGDQGGAWTDEDTPPRPARPAARRRLAAEGRAQASGAGAVVVLRVAGIYGPDRLPRRLLASGLALPEPAEAPWTNRIHVDDLVTTLRRAGADDAPPGVYDVADGDPRRMTEYLWAVADHLGLPRPPTRPLAEVLATAPPALAAYLGESRRIRARRLRERLGVHPRPFTLGGDRPPPQG
ncbi:NAD-dependent epimerase/dehydratase family protein [Inmirania thermothiophila]|uniref:Nucleoside-diphosphate-sugar epimerase n=1 Tax=Inmirania thermothiophila TaxID=1750597 RepID=A0A3N1Y795_9GAMM|nr:NAD-dependent epimerase/dehydratase family protein [Inmirania thermothiophila]ROR34391.1 nucleoside-diphosphate-sugar epimerase [Inmirania thermothiophila]